VTGTRSATAADLAAFTARVRGHTDLPLYVGFGIDGAARAREAAAAADGAIVGSALIKRLIDGPDARTGLAAALALVDEMLTALSRRTLS
jgi:tryptophan synthase alpha chain